MSGTIISAGADCNKNRVAWIDSLKGFAIICVVLGHVLSGSLTAGGVPVSHSFGPHLFQAVHAFHMPLFFLISGFVFSLAYYDALSKVKVQLADLAVSYVVFSALIVAFNVLCARFVNRPASFDDLLAIWRLPISPYWYLYVLFVFYVISTFAVKMRVPLLALVLVSLFLSVFADFISLAPDFCIWRLLFYSSFFCLGILAHRAGRAPGWPVSIAALCVSLTLCAFYWSPGWADGPDGSVGMVHTVPVVSTIVALGICVFIYQAFKTVKWLDCRTLALCGRYCLEIYLLHCFLTAGFRVVFGAFGCHFVAIVIISTILSTALPILFAMWLERLGVHDILFRPAHWFKRRAFQCH